MARRIAHRVNAPSATRPQEYFMSLQDQFTQAQADSKNLPERPDNMTLLKIYALFKQASSGDASGERPGFTDMVGRAKFDAWDGLKGTSKEEAMQQYIDLIEELKG
jgi:acyl-CoA-binding protein